MKDLEINLMYLWGWSRFFYSFWRTSRPRLKNREHPEVGQAAPTENMILNIWYGAVVLMWWNLLLNFILYTLNIWYEAMVLPWWHLLGRFFYQTLYFEHLILSNGFTLVTSSINFLYLSDQGKPEVRSLGPLVTESETLLRLNWYYSGWWRYQLNTNW